MSRPYFVLVAGALLADLALVALIVLGLANYTWGGLVTAVVIQAGFVVFGGRAVVRALADEEGER